ncbi:extracellular tyrosine-protein kinase PKDCC-like [Indicator indicator]|uniref:extracellular tyrosine-protein kinase PKDCC-like n=1 Tax=Indicator indicator TaxID=1002788 RepID=UPI0023DF4588|nr:extracellular tyrosine-protein kinase PKDCC-like [Indicator indicator]
MCSAVALPRLPVFTPTKSVRIAVNCRAGIAGRAPAGTCRSLLAAPIPTPCPPLSESLQLHHRPSCPPRAPADARRAAAVLQGRTGGGGWVRPAAGFPPSRPAPSAALAFSALQRAGGRAAGGCCGAVPRPMAVAETGEARRSARLSAVVLLALALLALLAGRRGGGEGQLASPPPPLPLPPGLREELWQRQRDLRRLAAAAGGGEALEGGLGCGDLSLATGVTVLGWGFTKVVARAALAGGGAVALKSVHGAGREVRQCVQRYGAPAGCRRLAAYKLMKEVTLLQRLQHPGIVQLQGQCYDNSRDPEIGVTAMLELGSPLEMIQLLQTPWEERFKICLSLVKLLFYLAHSPLGSIVLLDFQPRQFVMVNGNLKVTDMDDASTEELSCKEDNDCTLDFPTKSFPLKCSAVGKCEGINEKKNLFNAYRYFFTYLLPHSAPAALQPFLSDILNATGDLRYGINETLKAFEKVLHLYKSGLYLQKRPLLLKDYISVKGFRIAEGGDYKCWPSYSHLGCLLSVHSAEEAAAICNSQSRCQSFIITQERTWTGRPLASFQSSLTDLIPDANAVVYIKQSSSSGERL